MDKKVDCKSNKAKIKDTRSKEENSMDVDDDELLNKEFENQIIQDRYHRKYLGREFGSRYTDDFIKKSLKKEKDKNKEDNQVKP